MDEDLLQKAMKMFEEDKKPDKWYAFMELMNRSGKIQNRWWQRLQTEVYNREREFYENNPDWNWEIKIYGDSEIKWFIKGNSENEDVIIIHFNENNFTIFFDGWGQLDSEKVSNLLQDKKYDVIGNSIEIAGKNQKATSIWESNLRNFRFDSIYDGRFPNSQTLSWYAGNRTNDFAEKLIAKVRKIQTHTKLFEEIIKECRKDNQ